MCGGGGGGVLKKSGCEAAPTPARSVEFFFTISLLNGQEITLMGSLQISSGSDLGKVCMQ